MWFELGHHIVWYIHVYGCSGGAFCVSLYRPDEGRRSSRPNRLCLPFTRRLHGPITQNTTISNYNVMHFSCIVSLCYIKHVYIG